MKNQDPGKITEKRDIAVVFSGNSWQAEMVKSLLKNEGIEAYLKDDIIGTIIPWYAAPGGAGAVKVAVSTEDMERALLVVREYENNEREG